MPAETRYVAISADRADLMVYAGPSVPTLPDPPEGREWIEEYRAFAAGYSFPGGYQPEQWAAGAGVPRDESQPAVTIKDALTRHLGRSNTFLASLSSPPTPLTLGELNRVVFRHEKAINLLLRAMLEDFDEDPPASVTGD